MIAGVTLAFMGTAAYARVIPGWDRPWDPPNYYSPTTISWADTNNPSFFYRDLGWQGGSVLDPKRLTQWVTTVSQCISWLSNAEKILELKILNSLPLAPDLFTKDQEMLLQTREITEETYRLSQGPGILGSADFRHINRWNEKTFNYDVNKQSQIIEAATGKVAEASAHAVSDADDINARLDELLTQAANAQGEREIMQIKGEIQALSAAVWARRNTLLINLATMDNINKTVENDERIAIARQNQAAMLTIADPYNRSEYQKKLVPKNPPKGFVRFEH